MTIMLIGNKSDLAVRSLGHYIVELIQDLGSCQH